MDLLWAQTCLEEGRVFELEELILALPKDTNSYLDKDTLNFLKKLASLKNQTLLAALNKAFYILVELKKNSLAIQVASTFSNYDGKFICAYLDLLYQEGHFGDFERELGKALEQIQSLKLWPSLQSIGEFLPKRVRWNLRYHILDIISLIERNDEARLLNKSFNFFTLYKENTKRFEKLELDFIKELLDASQDDVIREKIKLLYKLVFKENMSQRELVEAIVLFHERPELIELLDTRLKDKPEAKVKIVEEIDALHFEVSNDEVTVEYTTESVPEEVYSPSDMEKSLLRSLKLGDEVFEQKSRDLIVAFINLEMFTLAYEYCKSFEPRADILYLELEMMLRLGRYAEAIERLNETVSLHEGSLPFKYLKGLAFQKLGLAEKAKDVFLELSGEDVDFRKIKEKLS